MEINEIRQGDRVTYVVGDVEYDAVALQPVTTGYNNAIRASGFFLKLRYLNEDGDAVTINSAPLLMAEEGRTTGWLNRVVDDAKRAQRPEDALPVHEHAQPTREVPPAVLGVGPAVEPMPDPMEADAVVAAADAEMAARSAPHDEFKVGDIVRFTPESGNDQTKTYTVDGGELAAGQWFWRLVELPGSLFLASSIELALPKESSATPTTADPSADSSSPTPAVVDDQATDVAAAAAPDLEPDEPVADATGDPSAS